MRRPGDADGLLLRGLERSAGCATTPSHLLVLHVTTVLSTFVRRRELFVILQDYLRHLNIGDPNACNTVAAHEVTKNQREHYDGTNSRGFLFK